MAERQTWSVFPCTLKSVMSHGNSVAERQTWGGGSKAEDPPASCHERKLRQLHPLQLAELPLFSVITLPTLATSSRTFHPAMRHGRPSALYSPEVEHRHHRRQFFGMASSPPSTLQSFARSRGLLLCIMPVHTSRCHQARIPRVKGRLPCIMIQFFQESLAVPSTRLWEQHGRPRQPRVRPSKLHGHVATTHVGPHN